MTYGTFKIKNKYIKYLSMNYIMTLCEFVAVLNCTISINSFIKQSIIILKHAYVIAKLLQHN